MILVIKPHDEEPIINPSEFRIITKVFLAGTIDCGNSEDWQSEYIENMSKSLGSIKDVLMIIYNPRRDPGKGFSPDNEEEMEYQVNWELDHMEKASFIYMNILPDSKSPISLMEIGLFAHSNKLRIVCPKEFYRYQNVKIVCDRYNIPFKEHYDDKWSIQF